ncbi:MAG: nucleoside triphosphate pyrophosphohydrolase [Caulobacteraceae bacterium]
MARTLRFKVEKLIRDKLPEIMRAQGLAVFDRRLDDEPYRAALKTKLLEESQELAQAADRDELLGELADVSEVLRAITAAHGFSLEEVEAARLKKKDARGGFDDRVFNAAVSAPEGAPALDYYLARPGQYPLDDA